MPINREELPIYREGAKCPCKPSGDGLCDDCGKVIPYYRGQFKWMGGDEGDSSKGFQSHCPDHLHLISIGEGNGFLGTADAFRKLCMECYLIDRDKKYPGLETPFVYVP